MARAFPKLDSDPLIIGCMKVRDVNGKCKYCNEEFITKSKHQIICKKKECQLKARKEYNDNKKTSEKYKKKLERMRQNSTLGCVNSKR